MSEHDFHTEWCDHRDSGDTHDDSFPYCHRQIAGVKLALSDGEKCPPSLWVLATSAAHPYVLTSGQKPADDHRFDGIELCAEHYVGNEWAAQQFRMSSDAARSLAAALVRAANIQQGLTR